MQIIYSDHVNKPNDRSAVDTLIHNLDVSIPCLLYFKTKATILFHN